MRRSVKYVLWLSGAAALILFIISQSSMLDQSESAIGLPLTGQIIYIDPGHGGRDGGASSQDGIQEKEVALEISLYLRDLLQQSGAFVQMTRETDKELSSEEAHRQGRRKAEDLRNRVEMINESEANMMISIHLNSIGSSRWRGAQTFFHPKMDENRRLALFVQDELIRNLENTNRQAKRNQDIYMLKATEVPGVLVEVGFLSNPQEAALLATPEYQKKVAFSIYEGILRYYSEEKTLE